MQYKIGDIIHFYNGSIPFIIIGLGKAEHARYILTSIDNPLYVHAVPKQNIELGATLIMSSTKNYNGPLTQEEIDEIIDVYNNGNYDPNDYNNTFTLTWDEDDIPGIISSEPPTFKGCSHKWKKYVGIIQSYEYCEICDKKKSEV